MQMQAAEKKYAQEQDRIPKDPPATKPTKTAKEK